MDMFRSYDSFVEHLEKVGFMSLSPNKLGYPSLADLTQESAWHTGDERDPWQWKSRIAQEKRGACARLFDKKPGFVALSWYPLFLAARRGTASVASLYEKGELSNEAMRLYTLFEEKRSLGAHEIKDLMGITKENKSRYDNALVELQMGMFVTVSGTVRKLNTTGQPYGWPSIEYMLVEDWAGEDIMLRAQSLSPVQAKESILTQAALVKPELGTNEVGKFLGI